MPARRPTRFVGVLEAFQLGGPGTAWMLAVTLLAGELVSGLWLLVMPGAILVVPAIVFAARRYCGAR